MQRLLLFLIPVVWIFVSACASKRDTDSGESKSEMSGSKQTVEKTEKKVKKEMRGASDKAEGMADAAGATATEVSCKWGEDTRKIWQKNLDSGGCEVHYSKFGESSVIATANSDLSFCTSKVEAVKTNLETAGFTCE